MQTLKGHAHNVSCVAFHPDLPLIITGSEDGESLLASFVFPELFPSFVCKTYSLKKTVKSLQKTQSHIRLLSTGTVRIWHANTYRLENTLDYGVDRAWCIACAKGLNCVAMGYDEGSVMIKVSVFMKVHCVSQLTV